MNIIYNKEEKTLENGITALAIAKEFNVPLKEVLVAQINEKIIDLSRSVNEDGEIKFFTFKDKEGKKVFWHSSAHVLAIAVKRLHPESILGIGPAIDEGFYYDIYNLKIGDNDLQDIEKEIQNIIKEDIPFKREDISKEEANILLKDNKFKLEIIKDVNEKMSVYRNGEFYDLCRGPHVPSTRYVGHVKLLKVSGAYWKGDSKREVMTRIYGISFPSKKELEDYLMVLEERKNHDHKKIGKELELFEFSEFSPGSAFFTTKGAVIYNELIKFAKDLDKKYEYSEIITPLIAKAELWKISGHFEKYKENMFKVTPFESEEEYALKPMNCPFSAILFKSKTRSYRELPMRLSDYGFLHRYELEGTLDGLFRTRLMEQNDSHVYVMEDQIESEMMRMFDIMDDTYNPFDLKPIIKLATRPEKRIGDEELWDKAEKILKETLDKRGYNYEIKEGDGAFYGPKIDIYALDFSGKPEDAYAVSTIQLDFNLAVRFDAKYIGSDNKEHFPIVIHRSIMGSIGRFMGIILENSKGDLPFWISPVQVRVLTITEKNAKYAENVIKKLKENGIRVDSELDSGTLEYKIRKGQLEKIPYIIIIGSKEEEKNTISVRNRKGKTDYNIDLDEFISERLEDIKQRRKYEEK
jgi:threonyl-tRNA synthetase